jgi:hypothetical protein
MIMKLTDRLQNYKAIEDYRERPLIVYATSTRVGVTAQMAGDAVREFIDQINTIPESNEIDILIHSTGGDALAAWKLVSILRERFSNVAVLVPYMAFSAATIFALGADEIIMHPYASLGPIDPQIKIRTPDGQNIAFSFEDVGAFLRFISEVGITEQSYVSPIIGNLFSVVDPVRIGGAKRASELSASVGERLLLTHMTGAEDKIRAFQIAQELNKSFFAHGDAVSRTRAKELQLKISDENSELEALMWDAYLGIESYMKLREPFNPLYHFLNDDVAAQSIEPTSPLKLPPNAPDQMVQQLWNHVAQQAMTDLANPAVKVSFSLINAIIESTRYASEFLTSGTITACRVAGGEIKLATTTEESSWRPIDFPEAELGEPPGTEDFLISRTDQTNELVDNGEKF